MLQHYLRVIIISYNVATLMRRCLKSLYAAAAQENINLQVIVVDNNSHDDSVSMVQQGFPQAAVTVLPKNIGFAGASNYGLSLIIDDSTPEPDAPILLLNPDTEICENALTTLLYDYRDIPNAAVIAPGLRYADNSLQHAAFKFPGLAQTIFEFFPINWRLTESPLNGRYTESELGFSPFRCDHPLGAAMLLRPAALREIGPLDDTFFMYAEEVDWCWRAVRLGWTNWSDPRAIVIHHAGQSAIQEHSRMYVQLWRSRYELWLKHNDHKHQMLYRSIVRLGILKQLTQFRCLASKGKISEEAYQKQEQLLAEVLAL